MSHHALLLVLACLPAGHVCPARADSPVENCTAHDCSNDSLEPPVVGDEFMAWDPPECLDLDADGTCEAVTRYQVSELAGPLPELCDGNVAPRERTAWTPYGSGCFPREGQTHAYVVRACGALGCGDWPGSSKAVEFEGQPYSCLDTDPAGARCQTPCYDGAPLAFNPGDIPLCPSP